MRYGLVFLALLYAAPAMAQSDTADLALAVQAAVAAACGNCVLDVRIADPADRGTWSIDFTGGATALQQQSAFAALQSFDLERYQADRAGAAAAPSPGMPARSP